MGRQDDPAPDGDPTAVAAIDLAPGVLWMIFTFAGLLGLHRSFAVEQAGHAMDGLLASPTSRESIFIGRALTWRKLLLAFDIVFVAGCVVLLPFMFEE